MQLPVAYEKKPDDVNMLARMVDGIKRISAISEENSRQYRRIADTLPPSHVNSTEMVDGVRDVFDLP